MNLPARTSAAPETKSDAPTFTLAPARPAAAPAARVGVARNAGSGLPSVGKRSGTSGGGSGGNGYFSPEEEDQAAETESAPTPRSGRGCPGHFNGLCERVAKCDPVLVGSGACLQDAATPAAIVAVLTTPVSGFMPPLLAATAD